MMRKKYHDQKDAAIGDRVLYFSELDTNYENNVYLLVDIVSPLMEPTLKIV